MTVLSVAEATWEEVDQLNRETTVLILPVGATEAHGPHLPLNTDVIIAQAMAREGARHLDEQGLKAAILPAMAYSVAGYAAGFAGTVSIEMETATALLCDVASAYARHGFRWLAFANAHLEPNHIQSLYQARDRLHAQGKLRVIFPDVTRKPWALRLTDEFKSGACHAGCYESSIVLAESPELVREGIRKALPENPNSLSVAIREGRTTFESAGGPRAYFGAPAQASAAEGRETITVLGQILADAVVEVTAGASS